MPRGGGVGRFGVRGLLAEAEVSLLPHYPGVDCPSGGYSSGPLRGRGIEGQVAGKPTWCF